MPKIDAKMFLVRKLAPRIPTELRCLSTWASSQFMFGSFEKINIAPQL